jgi:GNAT superfamily N-acetyltransferase
LAPLAGSALLLKGASAKKWAACQSFISARRGPRMRRSFRPSGARPLHRCSRRSVAIRLDRDTRAGEIGLNAVDPARAGAGIGTAMYEFAVRFMQQAGMRVATVATGGDPSHAPARRAYQKAGFDVQFPSVWMCRKL